MTKKGYKAKYQPQPEDMNATGSLNRQLFVARIVNTENKALTAKEVHALINNKIAVNRGRTHINTQANLADAVRTGRLDKTRILIEPRTDDDPKGYRGKSRVVYHPTTMKPMGLDIPIPLHTKTVAVESTSTDDDDDVFTFDDDEETEVEFVRLDDPTWPTGPWKNKPAAVKVAEKVIADIAGLPDSAPTVSDFIPPHTKHTPIDNDVFNRLAEKHKSEGLYRVKHNKDEPIMKFDGQKLVDALEEEEKKRLAGLSSTIQHHFTAEQLLDTLNALNPDLHDDVIIAIYEALGKPVYNAMLHDFTKPQPRKTAFMKWAFVGGNLVVKQ